MGLSTRDDRDVQPFGGGQWVTGSSTCGYTHPGLSDAPMCNPTLQLHNASGAAATAHEAQAAELERRLGPGAGRNWLAHQIETQVQSSSCTALDTQIVGKTDLEHLPQH